MAAPKPKKINLLIQEGFENTQIGKVLNWLLGAGRVIVILTELVVIIAFLSRFWLDRQLTDLIEENKTKKTQLESSVNFETDYKNLQARLLAVKELDRLKLVSSEYIKEATRLLPAEVLLSNISYNQDKVTLVGTSLNEAGLAGLLKSLEESAKFTGVSLTNISLDKSTPGAINFSLGAEIEGKKTEEKE